MSQSLLGRSGATFGITVWVVVSIIVGQIIGELLILSLPLAMNPAVQTTFAAVAGYAFAIAIVVGAPMIPRKGKKLDLKQLGIERLPSWSDIGLGMLSVLPYFMLASFVVWLGTDVFNFIDPNVGQQKSFTNLYQRIEYLVAFFTLVILAPLAEEFLFRGYFQGKVMSKLGKGAGVVIVAMIFGFMHLFGFTQSGVVLQWGAAADTFSLGIIAGSLRLLTGSIWAGVILHAAKNAIAYYFLFIAVAG